MKTLLLASAVLALSSCSVFNDCGPFEDGGRDVYVDAAALLTLSGEIVVALVETPQYPLGGVVVDRDGETADSVRVRGSIATRLAAPAPQARLAARGDTLFVTLVPASLTRLACSPPPVVGDGFFGISLPAGVTIRTTVRVPSGPRPIAAPAFSPSFRPILRA